MSAALGGALPASDERAAPVGGVPRGWAGWRRREGEGRLLRAAGWRGLARLPLAVAFERDVALRDGDLAGAGPVFGPDVEPASGDAGRLSLRR